MTVFLVAHQPVSNIIGVTTIALLLAGYGVWHVAWLGQARVYLETVFLSLPAFFVMVPTVFETLRRLPDWHPIVTDLKSPVLLGAQGAIVLRLSLV